MIGDFGLQNLNRVGELGLQRKKFISENL